MLWPKNGLLETAQCLFVNPFGARVEPFGKFRSSLGYACSGVGLDAVPVVDRVLETLLTAKMPPGASSRDSKWVR